MCQTIGRGHRKFHRETVEHGAVAVANRATECGGAGAHIGLGHPADGEQRSPQLALRQHVHDVALILGCVGAALERREAPLCPHCDAATIEGRAAASPFEAETKSMDQASYGVVVAEVTAVWRER